MKGAEQTHGVPSAMEKPGVSRLADSGLSFSPLQQRPPVTATPREEHGGTACARCVRPGTPRLAAAPGPTGECIIRITGTASPTASRPAQKEKKEEDAPSEYHQFQSGGPVPFPFSFPFPLLFSFSSLARSPLNKSRQTLALGTPCVCSAPFL